MSLFTRLPGYFMTGGAAAVVDIGGFATLSAWGLATPLAATLSFLVAAVVNYGLTTALVFVQPASPRQFGRFLAAALVGLAINVMVTTLLVGTGIAPVFAKTGGVGVAFLANYLLAALVVFRPPDQR
jgi:putative flippase GtrA